MDNTAIVEGRYEALVNRMDEATLCMSAARSLEHGGISTVVKATGMSRTTIYTGLAELKVELPVIRHRAAVRVRAAGGGRKKRTAKDTSLLQYLDALVGLTSRGDPMSPLRWACKSTYRLAEKLNRQGNQVSQRTVCDLLSQTGYSLQSTRKTREGKQHEDRDAQFRFIAQSVSDFQAAGDPVISVDTKKKALIGDFKSAGREWQPMAAPERVRVHDFINLELGKVAPYGVYDLTANTGWVNVGIDHNTTEFAVQSIRRSCREMGEANYPNARHLLITADCGGSNGYRVRLSHSQLHKLADELRLTIHVCHFPPGTSKWNKIEHSMFCHVTANWRGHPLISRHVVVNLIGGTTTRSGLRIKAGLDENSYTIGIKISDAEHAALGIERNAFHGEWNYSLPSQAIDLNEICSTCYFSML